MRLVTILSLVGALALFGCAEDDDSSNSAGTEAGAGNEAGAGGVDLRRDAAPRD